MEIRVKACVVREPGQGTAAEDREDRYRPRATDRPHLHPKGNVKKSRVLRSVNSNQFDASKNYSKSTVENNFLSSCRYTNEKAPKADSIKSSTSLQ